MQLTYDHKVALYDRLAPHLDHISHALGVRVQDLGSSDPDGFKLQVAKNAVDATRAVASSVAERPDPTHVIKSWEFFGGRVVVMLTSDRGGSASLVLGRLCLCAGLERVPRDRAARLAASGELGFSAYSLSTDLEATVWRFTPWFHGSLDVSRGQG